LRFRALKAIIIDALKRCATLGWTHRHDLQADLISAA
jgi:hypothetical protein